MDIFDILLDILLKPPQPFIGLFFLISARKVLTKSLQYWKRGEASAALGSFSSGNSLNRVAFQTPTATETSRLLYQLSD